MPRRNTKRSRTLLPYLLKLLSLLPMSALHALGCGVGVLLHLLPNRLRRNARDNVRRCFPELPEHRRRCLVRRALAATAKSVFETAALWNWSGPRVLRRVREITGRDCLEQAIAQGRGVIITMPHLGSWELAAIYCSSLHPMTTLYKPPRSCALEPMMLRGRQRLGARLVPTDTKGVRALYQALARREVVGILPDQNPKAGAGIYAPFFGLPAHTMTLIGRLAQKSATPLVYAYAERLPWGRGFRMHFRASPAKLEGVDLMRLTTLVNQGVEACVREAPEQYQWTYNRFKGAPATEENDSA